MAYQIIPGVRQDHKLRLYQVARYPNGKTINVPYTADLESPRPELEWQVYESKHRPGTFYRSMPFLQERSG